MSNYSHSSSISLYTGVKNPYPIGALTINEVIEAIRTGEAKGFNFIDIIEAVRAEKDKKKRNAIKKKLLGVTLSGLFSQRNEESLINHSGYLQIDIDSISNIHDTATQIKTDHFILAMFISPSGDGLKLILRIPADVVHHKSIFENAGQYFKDKYNVKIDDSPKNVSSLMYLSFDENIYVNENAQFFNYKPNTFDIPTNNFYAADKESEVERIVELIENQHTDITNQYTNWRNIGFSLADYFNEGGRDYFHRISRFNSKYDYQTTNKQFDECLKNRQPGAIKINTFFQIAKDNGIDISRKPLIQLPTPFIPNQNENAVSGSQNSLFDLNCPIKIVAEHTNDLFLQDFDFIVSENGYVIEERIGKSKAKKLISNFIMQFLYQFPDGTNNAKSLIKLQNKYGEIALLEVDANDMTNSSKFKAALKSKGNFHFYGITTYHLDRIQEFHNLEYKRAKELSTLGYISEGDFYAFSNGIVADGKLIEVDKMGIVEYHNQYYYLPAFSFLNKDSDSYLNEKNFVFQSSNMGLYRYSDLLYQAYGKSALIGMAFLVATIFRDVIFNYKQNFPYLFIFGLPGAGKTSFIDMLMLVFGKSQDGTSLSNTSTIKGIARKTAQLKNALVYFKEYSNNGMTNEIITLLKTAYDGIGYERAQMSNDNKTQTTRTHSGVIIDGNELPEKNSAVFSRCVLLSFPKSDYSEIQSRAFQELKELSKAGFGNVFLDVWNFRNEVKNSFEIVYKDILSKLKANECKGMENDRFAEHIALLWAPIKIIATKKENAFGFNPDQLLMDLIDLAKVQNELFVQTNEVKQFLDIMVMMSENGSYLYEKDYCNEKESPHIFRVKMDKIYSLYAGEMNKIKGNPISKNSIINLLFDYGYFIPGEQSGRTKSVVDKKLNTCYRLDTQKSNIQLLTPLPTFS